MGNLNKTLKGFLIQRKEMIFAYIFGSAAKKQETALSDVDIAVYIHPDHIQSILEYKASLSTDIQSLVKDRDIDLVVLNQSSPLLRHRVMSQGTLLFARDPLQEQRYFVDTLRQYVDTKPLRDIQAKYLKEYIQQIHKDNI